MNPRQRVLTAIDHHEPDRIPIDFGGTGISTAPESLQEEMRIILGFPKREQSPFLYFNQDIQEYFGCDFRRIGMRGPKNAIPKFDANGKRVDEWGVIDYADSAINPLRHFTIDDLHRHTWPDPFDPGRVEGIKDYARFLHQETSYAVVADAPAQGLFEAGCRFRGYDQFLLDMAINQDFVKAFFDIYLKIMNQFVDAYVGEIGEYIDIIWLGDDACTQRGPYTSPKMYQELVKPYFYEYIQHIKKYTRARIMHHCCGSCHSLIPDYLDIGIEILNPTQPEAAGMTPEHLKQTYGDRMTFHGGIGLQHVLNRGTSQQIIDAVKHTTSVLGKGGGYILAAAHSLPEDVPAENVITMLETAKNLTYPLD